VNCLGFLGDAYLALKTNRRLTHRDQLSFIAKYSSDGRVDRAGATRPELLGAGRWPRPERDFAREG
jgi:hypothetical protein